MPQEEFVKRRELRRKHADNPETPAGPECPRCKSRSYLVCRGTNLLQFKCVEWAHEFTQLSPRRGVTTAHVR